MGLLCDRFLANVLVSLGLPKMEVCQDYYGLPPPPVAFGPSLRLSLGDIVELTKAEVQQLWWEVGVSAAIHPRLRLPSWRHAD